MARIEITYDDSAAVFEAWLVSGEAREWLACGDTAQEARDKASAIR